MTVCEPTGCAVSTYSSTIARRIAALRSSSSIGTRFYRVPAGCRPAAPSAREEPCGHLVAEEPAPAREHDPSRRRPLVQRDRRRSSSSRHAATREDRPRAAGSLIPAAVRMASDELLASRRASDRASRRPASARRAGATTRRCSARACARSTTGGRRCGRARRSRSRGSRPAPSRGGCAGTPRPGRAQFETSYQSSPAAARRSSASTYLSAWSSSSGAAASPAATALPERRARLDGERVRAHVLGLERERGVERALASRRASRPGVP